MRHVIYTPNGRTIAADWSCVAGRINFLFDCSGHYAPVNAGRARQIADEYGWSKSSVQMMIAPQSDYLPRRETLRTLVTTFLAKTALELSPESILMWLEYAPVASNPFIDVLTHSEASEAVEYV